LGLVTTDTWLTGFDLDPDDVVEIPLTKGLHAIIDARDLGRVLEFGPWHASVSSRNFPDKVYARHRRYLPGGRGKITMMHQFIMESQRRVDHINGNTIDNRASNLRPSTNQQNCANQRMRTTNTSGFKGVTWYSRDRIWVAQIKIDGKTRRIGKYVDPVDAARAYDSAAIEAWGEFACINFPDGTQPSARERHAQAVPPTPRSGNVRSDNSSGYRGVNRKKGRWSSRISSSGHRIDLGTFDSAIAAALAYDAAAITHGLTNRINFPRR
jgi:hypothetical protein